MENFLVYLGRRGTGLFLNMRSMDIHDPVKVCRSEVFNSTMWMIERRLVMYLE